TKRVVGGVGKCIIRAEEEPAAEALIEVDDQRVVLALVEGAESFDLPLSKRRQKGAADNTRLEGEIALPDAQKITDVSVVVVGLDYHVPADLTLHAGAVAERMRSLEGAVNSGGIKPRRKNGIIQYAERTEDEVSRRLSDGRACLRRILIRRQPRQSLHVADVNRRVSWYGSMSGRDHAVEPVDADHGKGPQTRKPASQCAGCDLGIGQPVRKAPPGETRQKGYAGNKRR